jgi:hypothetical protein
MLTHLTTFWNRQVSCAQPTVRKSNQVREAALSFEHAKAVLGLQKPMSKDVVFSPARNGTYCPCQPVSVILRIGLVATFMCI